MGKSVGRKVVKISLKTQNTISSAHMVAHGFDTAVEKMNKNFTTRLNEIIRVENEIKEKAEAK